MTTATTSKAQELFSPLGSRYERWARILSLGQDSRWRRHMISRLGVAAGSSALDVAAGTGSITRLLEERGAAVVSLDQSSGMLAAAVDRGATGVLATGEALPFGDETFDTVTFGYLLRYVGDVAGCMSELTRVLRRGGWIGMVEFGRPRGAWRPLWWLYTRVGLPGLGMVAGPGWYRVGRFLGPSIDDFADRHPPEQLADVWRGAGLTDVAVSRLSLGGGMVMWGRKR